MDSTNNIDTTDPEQTFITGSDPNNYIWYSGKLWRAVSIDPSDNSIKLITQWNISVIQYSNGNSAFKSSYMESWLNDTSVDGFLYNLRDYTKFIKTDSKWNATQTTSTSKPAKTTLVTDPVGLLNLYEYTMSYGNSNPNNSYLDNSFVWFSLTPYNNTNIYRLPGNSYNPIHAGGIRPAINLKGNIKVVDGTGIETDPYRLEGDNDKDLKGTLLNTRYSGEYIRFGTGENNLYRIVSHETGGLTKITSARALKNNNEFLTSTFGSSINYSSTNTVGAFLNNDYLNPSNGYLTSEQVNMIEDNSTWYLGTVESGENYRLAKYTTTTGNTLTRSTKARVGLLRLGELMSVHYAKYEDIFSYWLLTQYSNKVRYIGFNGSSSSYDITTIIGIKPSINLKENVIITSGEGTKENPFTIELSS